MTAKLSHVFVGGIVLIGVGVAVGILIGDRHGHDAEATAAALIRAEKSANDPARAHHPDFPAKSPPPRVRDLHTLGVKIDPEDIRGSLRSISELSNPEEKIAAVGELMSVLPADRWMEVLQAYLMLRDPTGRDTAFEYIAARGPEKCLLTLVEEESGEYADKLLRAWAERDLPAALAFFEAHSEKMLGPGLDPIAVLTREYSRTNPDAALTWIGTLPDAKKAEATTVWLSMAAAKDVPAAVRLYESLPDHLRRGPQAEVIGKAWAVSDPEAAFKWAAGLPDNEGLSAKASVISVWTGRDFDAALKAASMLPPEARGSWLVSEALVAGANTSDSLARAGFLIEALPELGRGQAATSLVIRWSDYDPNGARAWVDGLPPGPTRDGVIFWLPSASQSDEFATSSERQTTIQDPEARQSGLKGQIVSWLKDDPEAARTWVKESPKLTPEDREALLKITGQ